MHEAITYTAIQQGQFVVNLHPIPNFACESRVIFSQDSMFGQVCLGLRVVPMNKYYNPT